MKRLYLMVNLGPVCVEEDEEAVPVYLMVNLGPICVEEDEEPEAKGQDEEAVPDGQPRACLCGGG